MGKDLKITVFQVKSGVSHLALINTVFLRKTLFIREKHCLSRDKHGLSGFSHLALDKQCLSPDKQCFSVDKQCFSSFPTNLP